ncbi:hypothetical protein B0H34DRAFT_675985 [Crassisporium funariophilum]|nr:hypothetical protein B0H34DRAFT_675985 [Crassisporium funariophilum]
MTESGRPAGTSGNPVADDLLELDGITPPVPDGDFSGRNRNRSIRRAAGETDVSDDEDEESPQVEVAPPTTPTDPTQAFLAAWAVMSEDQRKVIHDVITPSSTEGVVTPSLNTNPAVPIFSEEKEDRPVTVVGAHKFGIHPEVCNTKAYLIKVDSFPDENALDPTDWLEAWSGYLNFLEVVATSRVFLRWKSHYLFLSSQEDLRINFSAILRFDIEQRRQFLLPSLCGSEVIGR